MLSLADQIRRAAPLEVPVIIQGPTGAGKEHVAEALHSLSGRRGQFVPVNVASLSEAMADSELFGATRGAYTGASADRSGLVATAADGTLFLDEAADLALPVQAKLLRVLDSGVLRPVGATAGRQVKFRLVISVQEPAGKLVASGRWRADFYYRVAGLVIGVPALAHHPSDVPLLVRHFAKARGLSIAEDQNWNELMKYPWPGNVRQLRRAVERAAFDSVGPVVTAEAVLSAVRHEDAERDVTPVELSATGTLRDAARSHIRSVLASTNGDTRTAAVVLGLSRSQLYRKMQALGVDCSGRR